MYYIGIDLGGTNMTIGLINESYELVDKLTADTKREREADEIVLDMINISKEIIAKNGLTNKDIISIGVGSPGICDSDNGVIVYAGNIKFRNYNIKEAFQKHFDCPFYLGNDANVAALGEYIVGAGKKYYSSIIITLGTGVGGGYIEKGKVLTGLTFKGAEFGHMVIVKDGEQCTCGRKGCWEAYSSATALIREINRAAEYNPESKLNDYIKGEKSHTNAKMVFDCLEDGDKVAFDVVDRYYDYLAEGLANMVSIFDPEVIILGGGVAGQGEKMLKPVREKLKKLVFGGNLTADVVCAELGNDAGVLGAGLLSLDN
ncbi:MAG: ROK family protein [Lachnospirales bacterium]